MKLFTQRAFYLTILGVCLATFTFAQTRLAGTITDASTKDGLAGVSLAIKGKVAGTITDTKGKFSLTTSVPTPFTVIISSVGYQTQQLVVTSSRSDLTIALDEQVLLGQEVVVSGSRTEEELLKAPVSVEKLDIRALQTAPTASVYDALANVKGVDLATQGLLFKSVNLRGFGSTGNPRTVQLIDGMDNSAPGLNFPTDNIVGIPDLDLANIEVLAGAASALYGPNAIQGLILMNSKNPFDFQGLSANVKAGVMSASNRDVKNTGYYDASIRYAKAFNNKFAFKVNFSYITAKDWQATNYDNLNLGGNADPNRGLGTALNYDGTNTYGDEFTANLRTATSGVIANAATPAATKTALQGALNAGLIPNVNISRTGFQERDLVDYNTKSIKFNGAVHYRLSDKVELIGQFNYGTGTTVYTANGRYSLRDLILAQGKIELRGDNFTLRAYTTQERSGKSYTAGLTAIALNSAIKDNNTWYGEYAGAFAQAVGGGQSANAAQLTARAFADRDRPAPGTAAYTTLLDTYRNKSISQGGGGFQDKSNLYHLDATYNLKNQIKFAEVLVGANFRRYVLASEGTLFADNVDGRTGTINIDEYGAFAQVAKSLFGDHLKLTASGRYDKNQNFDGQFTPRVSAVASFGEQNFRVSYQTGFRIPTTQNQYIDLRTPQARLIGGLPEFDTRYNLSTAYTLQNVQAAGALVSALASTTTFRDQVTSQLTAQVQPQVVAAVTAQVSAAVTQQVNAAVAAGQLPAAAAATAIQQGVAAQLATPQIQGLIQQNVTAAVAANKDAAIQGAAVAANLGALTPYKVQKFQPERVVSYELGYRGILAKRLFVDAYGYTSRYTNFLGSVTLIKPTASLGGGLPVTSGVFGSSTTRDVFSRPANSSESISTSGWGLGLTYQLSKGYSLMGNISNNNLNNFKATNEVQFANFNTPKYRYNLTFSKRPTNSSRIGYSLNAKHQDEFIWQGFAAPSDQTQPFYSNTIVPAINNLDAQVSYKVSSARSIVRLGATNLFGKPYIQAYGSPSIGSMYYVSITFDELMNR